MKSGTGDLAVFGGRALFAGLDNRQCANTDLVEKYLTLVRKAYDSRWLTNGGVLVLELEARLAAYHGVPHCVAVANVACGLLMLLRTLGPTEKGEVIMPAFSYRGLPYFARWAGHMPRFCDVDAGSHTLDPDAVQRSIGKDTVAVLAVSNFNSTGDVESLCDVARKSGIPIVFDSVYAMANTHRGIRMGGFGAAEVFSLHATKLLNGFEGGYITTHDAELAQVLRWQRNFSLPAFKPGAGGDLHQVLGINAKLNELHAAMALLCLERLDQIIAGNRARFEAYQEQCRLLPGLTLVPYPDPDKEQSNYQMAVVSVESPWPLTRDQTVRLLCAEGAQISGYYSPALHLSEHCPRGMIVPSLPVSEMLAERHLQLPVGELVSLEHIHALGNLLGFVYEHGAAIRTRLMKEA